MISSIVFTTTKMDFNKHFIYSDCLLKIQTMITHHDCISWPEMVGSKMKRWNVEEDEQTHPLTKELNIQCKFIYLMIDYFYVGHLIFLFLANFITSSAVLIHTYKNHSIISQSMLLNSYDFICNVRWKIVIHLTN